MKKFSARQKKILGAITLFIAVVIAGCITIETNPVQQPTVANANTVITATMDVKFSLYYTYGATYMAAGILVPSIWDESQIQMSFSNFNISPASGTMVPVGANDKPNDYMNLSWPDALRDKLGLGPNYVTDMKWVVFRSVQTVTPGTSGSITGTVTIKANVGPQNLKVKLGYAVASSTQSFRDAALTKYIGYQFNDSTHALTVKNGTDPFVDYTVPQITSSQPVKALDNDIITLNYDEAAISTNLSGAASVYLCAKAFTAGGVAIDGCGQTTKTKLVELPGKKFRIDLWPRGYFNVADTQRLDRIEYYFTDATGGIKVLSNGNTGSAFTYKFSCQ